MKAGNQTADMAIACRLQAQDDRIAELEAEVREWLCADCKTVYPGPPTKGFDCVICPKCKGRTGPKNTIRIAELEAALRDIYTRNVGVEGYERHCFTLKDIAGRALGDEDE